MKGFYSSIVFAGLVFASMSSNAATMRDKKVKEDMLARVDSIQLKLVEIRTDLKKEDVVNSCSKLKEIFKVYPDHVSDVGVRLDPFEHKCAEIRNDALNELITIHQNTRICDKGSNSEYVDPKALSDQLKSIQKSLKHQRKIIEKNRTSFENNFHYDYDFDVR